MAAAVPRVPGLLAAVQEESLEVAVDAENADEKEVALVVRHVGGMQARAAELGRREVDRTGEDGWGAEDRRC